MNLIYDEGGVYIRNLANTADKHGIGQYCFARNFELAGSGYVISDGSAEYKCVFINRETMTLNDAEHYYECLKLVNSTYFVRFGTDVLVLDLEQQMATLILNGKTVCGVPFSSGFRPEGKRHTDAGSDMVGTSVSWVLGCGCFVNHDYFTEDKVLVGWSPKSEETEVMPCRAVKIKGAVYLVVVEGGVPDGVCAPAGTSRVIMLQDYDRMIFVGCVTGAGFDPVMISGYARPLG